MIHLYCKTFQRHLGGKILDQILDHVVMEVRQRPDGSAGKRIYLVSQANRFKTQSKNNVRQAQVEIKTRRKVQNQEKQTENIWLGTERAEVT